MAAEPDTRQPQHIGLVLWTHRVPIILTTIVAGIAAGATGWILPDKYEATVILSPVSEQEDASRLSGALTQLTGLPALSGLVGSGGSRRAEAIATLESNSITQEFIRSNGLLPVLFHDHWDESTRSWRTSWTFDEPTTWKGADFFKKHIRTITDDTRTGLVHLTITWTDPISAAQWANDLVKRTNEYMQAKAIEESERNLDFLRQTLTETVIIEVRESIFSLMEAALRNQMLARGTEEYALKVVDPAVPPERPSSPRLMLIVLTGLLAGFCLSAVFAIARNAMRQLS